MKSNFLQLFKRGRYVSVRALSLAEADVSTRQKRHEERERFSVAAAAFCLRYDKVFKAHFLKAVANLTPKDISKVTVEPERWGDLVLEGSRHVLVLEFKLGALLEDHQSPEARIFSESGYGAEILKHFSTSKKALQYIVVGKDFQSCARNGLRCSAVPWWKLLEAKGGPESAMERDFYDCLGNLGAQVFLNRHMKKHKLTNNARLAMHALGSLKTMLEEAGLPAGRSDCDSAWFGVEIRKSKPAPGSMYAKLVTLVQPKERALGWVGYEVVEDEAFLSVWFYTTAETASAVGRRLKGFNPAKNDCSNIYVHFPGDKTTNDAEWFVKVLKAAVGD